MTPINKSIPLFIIMETLGTYYTGQKDGQIHTFYHIRKCGGIAIREHYNLTPTHEIPQDTTHLFTTVRDPYKRFISSMNNILKVNPHITLEDCIPSPWTLQDTPYEYLHQTASISEYLRNTPKTMQIYHLEDFGKGFQDRNVSKRKEPHHRRRYAEVTLTKFQKDYVRDLYKEDFESEWGKRYDV